MATFQDFNRHIKEPIEVDSRKDKRWTPQKVKFYNHENEYWGTFKGTADFVSSLISDLTCLNIDVDSANIITADILSANIKYLSANGIDLSKYDQYIIDLSTNLGNLSNFTLSSKQSILEQLSSLSSMDEIQNYCINKLSLDLDVESKSRVSSDGEIRNEIKEEISNRKQQDSDLCVLIINETSQRIKNDKEIKESILSSIYLNRKYEYVNIPISTFNFKVKDFASNVINTNIPYAYLQHDTTEEYLGRIYNVESSDNGQISAFSLYVFSGITLSSLTPGDYSFNNINKISAITGPRKEYILQWNIHETDSIKMTLIPEQGEYLYDITYVDDILNSDVGDIINYTKIQSGGQTVGLSSGHLLIDNIDDVPVPWDYKDVFKGKDLKFNISDDSSMSTVFNDDKHGMKHAIGYDGISTVTLSYNFQNFPYQDLSDDIFGSFGRIYKDDTIYANDNKDISAITIRLNKTIEGVEYKGNFGLCVENGFRANINNKDAIDIISSSINEQILISHLEEYYQCALSGYDTASGGIMEKAMGYLKITDANIKDVTQISNNIISVQIQNSKDYRLDGEYELIKSIGNIYKATAQISNDAGQYREFRLTYDYLNGKNFINFEYDDTIKLYGYLYVDTNNTSIYKNLNHQVCGTNIKRDENRNIIFDSIDEGETQRQTFSIDLGNEVKTEGDKQYLNSTKNSVIIIDIPQTEYNDKRGREFDIYLTVNGLKESDNTHIRFLPKYNSTQQIQYEFYSGRDKISEDGYRLIQADNRLHFQEYKQCKFQITDLNNTTINSDYVNVDKLLIANEISTKSISTDNLAIISVDIENITTRSLSATSITADYAIISNLTYGDKLSVYNLGVNRLSVYVEEVSSSTIEELSVTDATIISSKITDLDLGSAKVSNGLSIDSSNLYLTDRISSLNDELSDLERKTDFLLSVGRDSMEYKGTLLSVELTANNLSVYMWKALGYVDYETGWDHILKRGWEYRISSIQTDIIDCEGLKKSLYPNDYIVFNTTTIVKNVKFSDFDLIRDAQGEVEDLKRQVVHLSGGNTISGFNEFTDRVLINNLSVSDTISSENITVNNLTSEKINVKSINLTFTDTLSTFKEISSEFDGRIKGNDEDISTISSHYGKTFDKYDDLSIPDCLIIRDESIPDVKYKLTINHGLLTVNKIN